MLSLLVPNLPLGSLMIGSSGGGFFGYIGFTTIKALWAFISANLAPYFPFLSFLFIITTAFLLQSGFAAYTKAAFFRYETSALATPSIERKIRATRVGQLPLHVIPEITSTIRQATWIFLTFLPGLPNFFAGFAVRVRALGVEGLSTTRCTLRVGLTRTRAGTAERTVALLAAGAGGRTLEPLLD